MLASLLPRHWCAACALLPTLQAKLRMADAAVLQGRLLAVFAAFGRFHRKYPFARVIYKYFLGRYCNAIGARVG